MSASSNDLQNKHYQVNPTKNYIQAGLSFLVPEVCPGMSAKKESSYDSERHSIGA
jgi:hypothetical protein